MDRLSSATPGASCPGGSYPVELQGGVMSTAVLAASLTGPERLEIGRRAAEFRAAVEGNPHQVLFTLATGKNLLATTIGSGELALAHYNHETMAAQLS